MHSFRSFQNAGDQGNRHVKFAGDLRKRQTIIAASEDERNIRVTKLRERVVLPLRSASTSGILQRGIGFTRNPAEIARLIIGSVPVDVIDRCTLKKSANKGLRDQLVNVNADHAPIPLERYARIICSRATVGLNHSASYELKRSACFGRRGAIVQRSNAPAFCNFDPLLKTRRHYPPKFHAPTLGVKVMYYKRREAEARVYKVPAS